MKSGRLGGYSLASVIVAVLLLAGWGQLAAAASPSSPSGAPVIELKLGHFGAVAYEVQYEAFKKEVEERTKGRVRITIYHKSSLGDFRTHWTLLMSGGIDLAMMMPVYFPGKYPSFELFALPFIMSDLNTHIRAMDKMVRKGLLDKVYLNEIHHVAAGTSPANHIQTKAKKVVLPSDLKGVRIRGIGGVMTQVLEKVGAASVTVVYGELYSAFEKGVIEAALTDYMVTVNMRLEDFVRNVTELNASGSPLLLVMNKNSYAKLPPDIRKIIDEAGEHSLGVEIDAVNAEIKRGKAALIGKGAQVYVPTPAELQAWRNAFMPVWDDWLKTTASKGLNGKQLLHEYGVTVKELGGKWPYPY